MALIIVRLLRVEKLRQTLPLLAAICTGWLIGLATVSLLTAEPDEDLVPVLPAGQSAGWLHGAVESSYANRSSTQQQQPMGDFAAAMSWQRMRQNQSMYEFERPGRLLPMLRQLTAEESSASYRASEARAWLRTQSLVIVATVRSGMPRLSNSLMNLGRLRGLFKQSWMLILENNSDDGTRQRLLQLARRDPRVRVLGCGTVNSEQPCRIDMRYASGSAHRPTAFIARTVQDEIDRGLIMSVLRNEYLNYAYEHLGGKADLMLTIDPDIAWRSWKLNNILQGLYYFKTRPRLQQLCANTVDLNSGTLYDPCTLSFFTNKRYGEDTKYPYVNYEKSIQHGAPNLPPVKVESCFQAFAFYRFSDLRARRLQYERSYGEWICEHNTLSRQLQEVYLDPQMRLGIRKAA